MFFVVNKAKLQRIIAIVREDRSPASQSNGGPFLRIEAQNDQLTITSKKQLFSVTLYEFTAHI